MICITCAGLDSRFKSLHRQRLHPPGICTELALRCTAGATSPAGDDEGVIKLWDSRQSEATATLEAHSGTSSADLLPDLCRLCKHASAAALSGGGQCHCPCFPLPHSARPIASAFNF